MHLTPKDRVLIIEPRAYLHSWEMHKGVDRTGRYCFRVEIEGQPLTCAWRTAVHAWAAALRALSESGRNARKA
jgi:hypothetical protein